MIRTRSTGGGDGEFMKDSDIAPAIRDIICGCGNDVDVDGEAVATKGKFTSDSEVSIGSPSTSISFSRLTVNRPGAGRPVPMGACVLEVDALACDAAELEYVPELLAFCAMARISPKSAPS